MLTAAWASKIIMWISNINFLILESISTSAPYQFTCTVSMFTSLVGSDSTYQVSALLESTKCLENTVTVRRSEARLDNIFLTI